MEFPLISVIVPVYNVEKYIEKCVLSLGKQTYRNLELIFINDGSSDSSLESLRRLQASDNRIKVISQPNVGVAGARNRGLREAKGEYIAFVDGDDWIDLDTFELAIKSAYEYRADLVFWSYVREYPQNPKKTLVAGPCLKIWNEDNIDGLYCRLIGLTGEQLAEPQKTDSLVTVWGKLYAK